MDSDDDFETGLPKIPQKQCQFSLDFEKLHQHQSQSFSFELPKGTTSRNDKEEEKTIGPMLDKETIKQITTPLLESEDDETLQIMFGDFSEIEPLMEDVTSDGKIKKRILRPGTGKLVQPNQIVVAHYIIGAEHMDDLIESTYYTKRPRRFRAGQAEVIGVLDFGVQQMKVGEITKFLATSDYGFGKNKVLLSQNATIPPDSRVMIRVELLEALDSLEKDECISHLSPAERAALSFEELHKYALEIKSEGNSHFLNEDYGQASKLYLEALEAVLDLEPITQEENSTYLELRQQLCNNLAQAYYKLGKFKRVLKYAEDGINLPVTNASKAKSYYWYGKVHHKLGNLEESLKNLEKAYEMRPEKSISSFIREVKKKLKKAADEEKKICERMLDIKI